MANDPNTYYANPNETVDGSKLPSNITSIQGAGGNKINLYRYQTYIPSAGSDIIIGDISNESHIGFYYSNQPIVVNMLTGVISNNGFGFSAQETGIHTIHTGSLNSTIIGDNSNDTFWINGGNNNISAGTGKNTAVFHNVDPSNLVFSVSANGSITEKNIKKNTIDQFSNIQYFNFYTDDGGTISTFYDYSVPLKPITYQFSVSSCFSFLGSTIQLKIATKELQPGTSISYSVYGLSKNQYVNSKNPSVAVIDQNGNALINIQTINVDFKTSLSLIAVIDQFSFNSPPISLLAPAKLSASNLQINSGSVETFTISTQLPAGEKFDYTLSGVTSIDVPSVPLTGTLTADSSGNATLTVPIIASKSYQGDKKLTLTAGGSTSTVTVIDTAPKDPNTYLK